MAVLQLSATRTRWMIMHTIVHVHMHMSMPAHSGLVHVLWRCRLDKHWDPASACARSLSEMFSYYYFLALYPSGILQVSKQNIITAPTSRDTKEPLSI